MKKFTIIVLLIHILFYGLVIWFLANNIPDKKAKAICILILLVGFALSVIITIRREYFIRKYKNEII